MTLESVAPSIALAKDIVLGLAAATGAATAVMGLTTWRRQLRGNVRYELARRFLLHLNRFRDTFRSVRLWGLWGVPNTPNADSERERLEYLEGSPASS